MCSGGDLGSPLDLSNVEMKNSPIFSIKIRQRGTFIFVLLSSSLYPRGSLLRERFLNGIKPLALSERIR